ncbi:hypothetical protein H0H92_013093, partial [Tricholoma furcatifolium]
VHPTAWKPEDIALFVSEEKRDVTQLLGRVTMPTIPEPADEFDELDDILDTLNHHSHSNFKSVKYTWRALVRLIEEYWNIAGSAQNASKVEDSSSGTFKINGFEIRLSSNFGGVVNVAPVFHLVDSYVRHQERRVLNENTPCIRQEEDTINSMHIASLLAIADQQRFYGILPHDGLYTVHLMYPSATFEKMIILSGLVPADILPALEEGSPQLTTPIRVSRKIVDIRLDKRTEGNELLEIIATFVAEGIEASRTPRTCRPIRETLTGKMLE